MTMYRIVVETDDDWYGLSSLATVAEDVQLLLNRETAAVEPEPQFRITKVEEIPDA